MDWFRALIEPSSRVVTASLRDQGWFSAFGSGLRPDGTVQGYMQDGCETEELARIIRAGLDDGAYDYVLLVLDLHVETTVQGVWTQAISYNIGSREVNKRIFVPYELQDGDVFFHPSVLHDLAPKPWPYVPSNYAFKPTAGEMP